MDPSTTKIINSDEKYYVAVTPVLDFEEGNNIFYWAFSKSTNGETFLWKDKTDLLGSGEVLCSLCTDTLGKCSTWTKGTSCGMVTAGTDLCFQLLGWSSPVADEDIFMFDQPQLSNDGDGVVGSESDETRVLSDEEELERQEIAKYLRDLTEEIARGLDQEAELISDINGTPSWVFPVVVSASLLVFLATICIAIAVMMKFSRGVQIV